jgi:hypothetical protein
MKRTITLQTKQELEIEVQFPIYLKEDRFGTSVVALIDETTVLKIASIPVTLHNLDIETFTLFTTLLHGRHDVDTYITRLHTPDGSIAVCTSEEFDEAYFASRKTISKYFNAIHDAL